MLLSLVIALFMAGTYAQGCGVSTYADARVIGGETARRGAWPWQVAIYYNRRFHCGGSLISANWFVTASHCVDRTYANGFDIVLGEHNRGYKEGSEQVFKASRVIMHPYYNRKTFNNDIALIKLNRPAMLRNGVSTVCLPSQGRSVQPGSTCYITGWGKASHPGSSETVLRQSHLRVVSNNVCHRQNKPGTGLGISSSMICGGYGPGNTRSGCHGDSGGPFVCKIGNRWTLHGAVSWGSGRCSTRDAYTVFARVANFRNWIYQTAYV